MRALIDCGNLPALIWTVENFLWGVKSLLAAVVLH